MQRPPRRRYQSLLLVLLGVAITSMFLEKRNASTTTTIETAITATVAPIRVPINQADSLQNDKLSLPSPQPFISVSTTTPIPRSPQQTSSLEFPTTSRDKTTTKNKPNLYVFVLADGQFGNKIFQYTSGLGIFRKLGQLYSNQNQDVNLIYCSDPKIMDQMSRMFVGPFVPNCPDYILNSTAATNSSTGQNQIKVYPEKGFAKYTDFQLLPEQLVEGGAAQFATYLQSWRYHLPAQDEIRKILTFQPKWIETSTHFLRELATQAGHGSNHTRFVGVHVRTGYRSRGQAPAAWIFRALDYVRQQHMEAKDSRTLHFLLATDNRNFVTRKVLKRQQATQDVTLLPASHSMYDDFAILSACEGFILTCGTFGWWMAYSQHQRGPVVYYKDFQAWNMEEGSAPADIYPQHWIPL